MFVGLFDLECVSNGEVLGEKEYLFIDLDYVEYFHQQLALNLVVMHLFVCFRIQQVVQLAGYVSEHAAYHHGEASLTGMYWQ